MMTTLGVIRKSEIGWRTFFRHPAQACYLLLGLDLELLRHVKTILVYPGSFRRPGPHASNDFLMTEEGMVADGEAWETGQVVLAWDKVLEEGRNPQYGRNMSPLPSWLLPSSVRIVLAGVPAVPAIQTECGRKGRKKFTSKWHDQPLASRWGNQVHRAVTV